MRTKLSELSDFIQSFVNAISAILAVEVTVVDKNMNRIAATSKFHHLGEKILHASFFEKIFKTKQPSIVENAKMSEICNQCGNRFNCAEFADIAYPIFWGDEVIGVISIAAFSEEEREVLEKNKLKFEQFLKYMSMLIESKMATINLTHELESQLDEVIKKNKYLSEQGFIGENTQIKDVLSLADKTSCSDSTILIMGESGTGKEVLANVIHNQSNRKNKLMISVNCSAIPDTLVESELFGYEPGAFTGAHAKGYVGKFELANHSTLFLDEIGELPLAIQPKLLRVLQDKSITRLGSTQSIPIDVRIICATNQKLESLVEQGKFRTDLYYRLNVIPMFIPPLRQRCDDIPLLLDFLISHYNKKFHKSITCSPQVVDIFKKHHWPGNVRELKNIIEYLFNIKGKTDRIMLSDLPNHIMLPIELETPSEQEPFYLKNLVERYEKTVIEKLVKNAVTTEDKKNIAKRLGIGLSTLYKKMELYNI